MTDQTPASSSGFAGQQGLTDDASDFNKMSFLINQILGRVRTMTLVRVEAVTNDGAIAAVGFVDVLPLVSQINGIGNATPHATIFNMPYTRIQGGANAIILDPKVGDIGWAAIADRDISGVKSSRGVANPGSLRRFDLADGVYIGGILNGVPTQYIAFTDAGIKLTSATAVIIDAPLTTMTGALEVNGAITGGSGTGDSVTVQHHTHGSPPGPPPNAGT